MVDQESARSVDSAPPSAVDRSAILVSAATALAFELTCIRYVPGEVRVLGYFSNFVLLAAFVGLGFGMLLAKRVTRFERLAPLSLLTIVVFSEVARRINVGGSTQEFLFLEYNSRRFSVPLYPFLAVSYAVIAMSFVPFGRWVGVSVAGPNPLARYQWNLVGSLLGIAIFAAFSWLALPPAAWFALVGILALAIFRSTPRWQLALALILASAATGIAHWGTHDSIWSPYQKLTRAPLMSIPGDRLVPEWQLAAMDPAARARVRPMPFEAGFVVRVNDDTYQRPIDLSDAAVARRTEVAPLRVQMDAPFRTVDHPQNVLVIGAGTGNDVAAALRAGAVHVDAVEIDPAIVSMGRWHPEHPYRDPRVTTIVEDGRAFLQKTTRQYDLIVFGLVDSHILLSQWSNVRVDSYVYTAESFHAAIEHLTRRGFLVVSFAVAKPVFLERLRATLTAAAGIAPVSLSDRMWHPIGYIFVTGPGVPPNARRSPPQPGTPATTDDWPFPYLRAPSIPREYLIALAIILALSFGMIRVGRPRGARFDLHFFALGAAFLLLETRGITALALLFGATWPVNSAMFVGVLLMAMAATAIAARTHTSSLPVIWYALLAVALIVNALIPLTVLAALPSGVRLLLGAILVSSPMLASGVIFGVSLTRHGNADAALGWNLAGALLGGTLEYLSMITGFRTLLLLAGALYAIALLADLRVRRALTA